MAEGGAEARREAGSWRACARGGGLLRDEGIAGGASTAETISNAPVPLAEAARGRRRFRVRVGRLQLTIPAFFGGALRLCGRCVVVSMSVLVVVVVVLVVMVRSGRRRSWNAVLGRPKSCRCGAAGAARGGREDGFVRMEGREGSLAVAATVLEWQFSMGFSFEAGGAGNSVCVPSDVGATGVLVRRAGGEDRRQVNKPVRAPSV